MENASYLLIVQKLQVGRILAKGEKFDHYIFKIMFSSSNVQLTFTQTCQLESVENQRHTKNKASGASITCLFRGFRPLCSHNNWHRIFFACG